MTFPLTPITAFSGLSTPSRADPANFANWGDIWVAAEGAGAEQHNVLAGQVNVMAVAAEAAAVSAEASALAAAGAADAAAAASGVVKWISGTTYAEGAQVWSPADFKTYRRKVAGAGSTDPSLDTTNWSRVIDETFGTTGAQSIGVNTALTVTSAPLQRITSTVKGASLLLPSGTAFPNRNAVFMVENSGSIALPVRDSSGGLLGILPGGATGIFACVDFTTAAGRWLAHVPNGRPGLVTGTAQVNTTATTTTWATAVAIPGVTGKALLCYIQAGSFKARIATLNADGTVSLGAEATVGPATSLSGATAIALSSTTGLAAMTDSATTSYKVYSLTLNTSTNVVTVGSNATPATGSVTHSALRESRMLQYDADTAVWLSDQYIFAATHTGGVPTIAGINIQAVAGNSAANSVSLVGANVVVVGPTAAVLYTVSGNTLTQAATLSLAGFGVFPGSPCITQTFVTSSGKIVLATGDAGSSPSADRQFTLAPSGATLPAFPVGFGQFPMAARLTDTSYGVSSLVAGSSCVMLGAQSGNMTTLAMRVMRLSADGLQEVAAGAPDDMPIVKAGTVFRGAAVDGTRAIVASVDKEGYPQIMGLEVIKV